MSWFMVDVESNGQCPGIYSMTEFACILWDKDPIHPVRFHGKFMYLDGTKEDPEAIRAIGGNSEEARVSVVTPQEVHSYNNHPTVMRTFVGWVENVNVSGRPMFISDNNGFDYQFINYYCHKYVERNPFGHSSTNLGSLYKGYTRNMMDSFKKLRKTQHTHHPVDDCLGNLEAMDAMLSLDPHISRFAPDVADCFTTKPPRPNQA